MSKLGSEIIEGRTIGNGQIMIGSSISQPIPANITLTGGSLSITNGHNSINLETSNAGSFSNITLVGASNQIIFKPSSLTPTITLNATNPAASLVYNLPDVSANSDFVLTNGLQTINGTKTFQMFLNGTQVICKWEEL